MTELAHIERDGSGAIKGVYAISQGEHTSETLPEDHADVVEFRNPRWRAVNAERDRRLRRFTFDGREYDFCDGRGSDQNIAGAATLALAAVLTGVGWDENFTWIAADNTTVPMDAQTCLNFSKAAADWKARHIRAARALKDMSPIPADFADDSLW